MNALSTRAQPRTPTEPHADGVRLRVGAANLAGDGTARRLSLQMAALRETPADAWILTEAKR